MRGLRRGCGAVVLVESGDGAVDDAEDALEGVCRVSCVVRVGVVDAGRLRGGLAGVGFLGAMMALRKSDLIGVLVLVGVLTGVLTGVWTGVLADVLVGVLVGVWAGVLRGAATGVLTGVLAWSLLGWALALGVLGALAFGAGTILLGVMTVEAGTIA